MKNKTKVMIWIIVFAVFFLAALYLYNYFKKGYNPSNLTDIGSQGKEEEKIKAPDFTVYDKDGKEVKLSDFSGKPIVLNFWASWCPPCKAEMPDFQKVYETEGGEVEFMMINLTDGYRETKEKAKAHIKDNNYTFPVYFDTKSTAADVYGISSIPTTYFIDKDGYIVTGSQGAMEKESLLKAIEMIK